jgi:hypothetical protein
MGEHIAFMASVSVEIENRDRHNRDPACDEDHCWNWPHSMT